MNDEQRKILFKKYQNTQNAKQEIYLFILAAEEKYNLSSMETFNVIAGILREMLGDALKNEYRDDVK